MADDDRARFTLGTSIQVFGIVSMILTAAFAGFYKGVSESQKDIDSLRTELAVVTEKLQNSNQRQADILIELGKVNGRLDSLQQHWGQLVQPIPVPSPAGRRSSRNLSIFPNSFNGGTSQ